MSLVLGSPDYARPAYFPSGGRWFFAKRAAILLKLFSPVGPLDGLPWMYDMDNEAEKPSPPASLSKERSVRVP